MKAYLFSLFLCGSILGSSLNNRGLAEPSKLYRHALKAVTFATSFGLLCESLLDGAMPARADSIHTMTEGWNDRSYSSIEYDPVKKTWILVEDTYYQMTAARGNPPLVSPQIIEHEDDSQYNGRNRTEKFIGFNDAEYIGRTAIAATDPTGVHIKELYYVDSYGRLLKQTAPSLKLVQIQEDYRFKTVFNFGGIIITLRVDGQVEAYNPAQADFGWVPVFSGIKEMALHERWALFQREDGTLFGVEVQPGETLGLSSWIDGYSFIGNKHEGSLVEEFSVEKVYDLRQTVVLEVGEYPRFKTDIALFDASVPFSEIEPVEYSNYDLDPGDWVITFTDGRDIGITGFDLISDGVTAGHVRLKVKVFFEPHINWFWRGLPNSSDYIELIHDAVPDEVVQAIKDRKILDERDIKVILKATIQPLKSLEPISITYKGE